MMDKAVDPESVVASNLSVSDKIRRLAGAGYSRRQIADLIGRSYQQVRQVLVEDERRAGRRASIQQKPGTVAQTDHSMGGVSESVANFGGVYRLDVEEGGVVRLPSDLLEALEVRPGAVLIAERQDGGVRLFSTSAAWERARALFKQLGIDPKRDLVAELIAERRAEAEREERND